VVPFAMSLNIQKWFLWTHIKGFNPAKNTVIKNGVIGLTSHHGIHGNWIEDVLIENIHIRDFETHGIQVNQFTNLKLIDVEIGPSAANS